MRLEGSSFEPQKSIIRTVAARDALASAQDHRYSTTRPVDNKTLSSRSPPNLREQGRGPSSHWGESASFAVGRSSSPEPVS